MYRLTDEQVDYVLNDIRRRGVGLEDLQLNLLDHVCCILEQELKDGDEFERAYQQVIRRFYTKELKELEEETIQLLTFKNYYGMKRSLIGSGAFSAIVFFIGSILKIMHTPGAAICLVSGMAVFSLVFLPLVFLLKTKETGSTRQKVIMAVVTLVGILYVLSAMFLVQHWPGARIMWFSTLLISTFVLLPLYFFSGIRKPETKMNTIVTTIILLGVLGVQFTITAIRPSPQTEGKVFTYLQSEQLLAQMQHDGAATDNVANDIQAICSEMKGLIMRDMGLEELSPGFDPRAIRETGPERSVFAYGKGHDMLLTLKEKVQEYNSKHADRQIPVANTILDESFARQNFCSNLFALNNITQLQLFVASGKKS
ncbi:hypothetical protein [Polluticoccus soli]|uniref:hypothetical protein n=1 Tax=Polluticoccus soli TaxID=3034150 RepID=UPI0023E0E04E|nr:hypothetical protein [Flavipsychrobacter sp. JY13-12]